MLHGNMWERELILIEEKVISTSNSKSCSVSQTYILGTRKSSSRATSLLVRKNLRRLQRRGDI